MAQRTEITFRDRFTNRIRTGRVIRPMPEGRLLVAYATTAAVGRLPHTTKTVVRPEQIIEVMNV